MKIPNLKDVYSQPVKGNYETDDYCFFWSGPFSNWHPSVFTHKGIVYNCSEQAMMYEKAILFNDHDAAKAILSTNDPKEQKRLGRGVKGYIEHEWVARREHIVREILIDKFAQNPELLSDLLDTDQLMIVEASPYDSVWGIAMGVDKYPDILDQTKWKGQNLLGRLLMDVRERFALEREFENRYQEAMAEIEAYENED